MAEDISPSQSDHGAGIAHARGTAEATEKVEAFHGVNYEMEGGERTYERHPVVGLGGSAGGIAALTTFFQEMPADSGMIFVVVLHLLADHESLLDQLIGRVTKMPVFQATDGIELVKNSVYVIPPGHQIESLDGCLQLRDLPPRHGHHSAVDLFFRSLADSHGPHAAAVILSGADGDGAVGIKRIKENGGLTIAQDPSEAEYDGMPRSAIATGMVDWILPVAEMPGHLVRYLEQEGRLNLPPEEEPTPTVASSTAVNEAALKETLNLLRSRTGRDFTYYKRATILRRISRRMQVNNVEDLAEYVSFLRTHAGEAAALLNDLLISVTNFFRDQSAFQALKELLPQIFHNKGPKDFVRVWVTACATGEEAYSIAMLISEYVRTLPLPPAWQIFATDLDESVIRRARDGIYPDAIATDVSPERLERFFTKESSGYRVRRDLRESVLFAIHDILKDSPFSRIDLVCCRNLLIYLNREAQERALETFNFSLIPGGRLFLGSSESIDEDSPFFKVTDKRHRLFQQKLLQRRGLAAPSISASLNRVLENRERPWEMPIPRMGSAAGAPELLSPSPGAELQPDRGTSWSELHLQLIEDFAPPSLVVDANYDIVHLSENAGRFLGWRGGELSANLLKLVHPSLRIDLRTALFSATQTRLPASSLQIPMDLEEGICLVDIRVVPGEHIAPGFLLVVFESGEKIEKPIDQPAPKTDASLLQLEKELETVKARLRDTLEQSENSSEELKASNEELQAMNEELRSATEELETSREELQSINEELITVNQELKGNVDQLAESNSDLHNLMSATAIATIFLDRELRIMRYTPSAVGLFNLIGSDVGRPLSDLTGRLEYPEMEYDALQALEHLVSSQREVRSTGRWYYARVLPYRTTDDRIGGVVFTFLDITARRMAMDALATSEERLRLIIENASEYAIFSTDLDRKITSWNAGAERLLGYREGDIVGQSADLLFDAEERLSGACAAESEIAIREGRCINERWNLRKDGTRFWGSGALMAMRDATDKVVGFVKIFRDQTETREANAALEQSQEELLETLKKMKQAQRAKDVFVASLSHELRTPLNPVLLAVKDLSLDDRLPDDARDVLTMMERNISLEARLIDDLLDLNCLAEGKLTLRKEICDVHALIRLVIEMLQREAEGRGIHISYDLGASETILLTDPARFQQVIWNLLRNAIKFTPQGGRIAFRTGNPAPGVLEIEVTDSGIGIQPELLGQIFSPFEQGPFSGDHRFGGMGLGLAISHAIVEAQNGRIVAKSEGSGKGTSFFVEIPGARSPGSSKK